MSLDFETATDQIADLGQRLELFMSTCQRCGRCFKGAGVIEELKMHGYRSDNIGSERWVFRSESFLDRDRAADDIRIEMD
jgi:hydrogenase-4 component H